MAKNTEVRYINYYTSGSAAYKLVPLPEKKEKKVSLPKPKNRRNSHILISVDPIAVVGIVVAAVMVLMIASGIVLLANEQRQTQQMQEYVEWLKRENEQLRDTYTSGYDLEVVEKIALSLGMVPGESIQSEIIYVTVPQVPEEPSVWDNLLTFLTGLFA